MNLFYTLFFDQYVNGAFYPVPISYWSFFSEALATFPTVDNIPNISSISRRTKKIVLIILHHSGSLQYDKALTWFGNPNSYASTNFVIDRDGHIVCLVPEEKAALHMPNSKYQNSRMVNEMSIGVTLIGDGLTPFTDAQYEALAMLCAVWKQRYNLQTDDIKKHSEIEHTGERHTDPSPWDYEKFIKLLDNFDRV